MKIWFKYKYGFVNLDSENLYLTNSGNWSEVNGLKEKGIQKSNKIKKYRIQVFLTLCILVFGFLMYQNLTSGIAGLLSVIGIPMMIYSLYKYMNPELGSKFKIPFSKIQRIEISEKSVNITFLDAKNNEDSELINGVEEKGLIEFKKLTKTFANKSYKK